MKQSSLGLGTSTKRTRRREFLDEMDRVVPWSDLVAQIAPFMPEGNLERLKFEVRFSSQFLEASVLDLKVLYAWSQVGSEERRLDGLLSMQPAIERQHLQ